MYFGEANVYVAGSVFFGTIFNVYIPCDTAVGKNEKILRHTELDGLHYYPICSFSRLWQEEDRKERRDRDKEKEKSREKEKDKEKDREKEKEKEKDRDREKDRDKEKKDKDKERTCGFHGAVTLTFRFR